MGRIRIVLPVLALLALLVVHARLVRLDAPGPARLDLELGTGAPATLHLPEAAAVFGAVRRAERPPAVVLVHGYGGDRAIMSSLARRLAANGIAALALDLRGHGENRHPFPTGRAAPERIFELSDDLTAAVDRLRSDARVDGLRVALVGHSMGAKAVLDQASRDSGLDAVVAISGAALPGGPFPPANVLLLWAAGDPPRVGKAALQVASRLTGVGSLASGAAHGDPERGTAVRAVQVAGHDHLSILWSREAAEETLRWLQAAFGVQAPSAPNLAEPRLPWALAGLLLFAALLPGLGALLGALAPRAPELPSTGRPAALALLAGALVVTLPLAGAAPLASFLGNPVAGTLFGHLALVGVLLLAALAWAAGPGRLPLGAALGASLPTAALGLVVVFALLAPLGPVAHRLVPTPERALAALLGTLVLVPFFAAFELLLRRGSPLASLAWAVAGRGVLVGVLVLGVRLAWLPSVVGLLVGLVAALFVLVELVAVGFAARSRNGMVLAWLAAGWLAWLVAVTLPLTG